MPARWPASPPRRCRSCRHADNLPTRARDAAWLWDETIVAGGYVSGRIACGFVAEVPAPLAIVSVTLDDGSSAKRLVAEPRALDRASDITALGGWRACIAGPTATPQIG